MVRSWPPKGLEFFVVSKSCTGVFAVCPMIFYRSHPGIAFINILITCSFLKSSAAWIRASLVTVSPENLVCSAAAGAGSSPAMFKGATTGNFGWRYAREAFLGRFATKFSGVSVFGSKGRLSSFKTQTFCKFRLANWSLTAVKQPYKLAHWRVPRFEKIWGLCHGGAVVESWANVLCLFLRLLQILEKNFQFVEVLVFCFRVWLYCDLAIANNYKASITITKQHMNDTKQNWDKKPLWFNLLVLISFKLTQLFFCFEIELSLFSSTVGSFPLISIIIWKSLAHFLPSRVVFLELKSHTWKELYSW